MPGERPLGARESDRTRTDRGASEAIGFVLVAGLLVTSIGVVYAGGYGSLLDARDARQIDSAEQSFGVLAADLSDVGGGAPSRETELGLGGGTLRVGDPVTVSVRGTEVGGAGSFAVDYRTHPVVYDPETDDSARSRVVYEAGAVIRADRSGAVLVREPSLVLSPERTVVQVLRLSPTDARSVGGRTNARVRSERTGAALAAAAETPYQVTIEVQSPRADAWERALDGAEGTTCTRPAGDRVACTLTTERVHVSSVDVQVGVET
jgi:hypothetical protein